MDELTERLKLYKKTYAQLVINRSDGQHIDLFKELDKMRKPYNREHFNLETLANHEQREKEVLIREQYLCEQILRKYLK